VRTCFAFVLQLALQAVLAAVLSVAFAAGSLAGELTWTVEVEPAGSRNLKIVGPAQDFRFADGAGETEKNIAVEVTDAFIESGKNYGRYRRELARSFRKRSKTKVRVFPRKPGAEERRLELRVLYEDIKITSVKLRLITRDADALPTRNDFSRPVSLASVIASNRYDMNPGSYAADIRAWGDRLSYQTRFAESDLRRMQVALPASAPDLLKMELQRQLDMFATMALAEFPGNGVVPGAVYEANSIRIAAIKSVSEALGPIVHKTIPSLDEDDGTLSVRVVLNPLPDDVLIKVAGNSRVEKRLNDQYRPDGSGDPNKFVSSRTRYADRRARDADVAYLGRDRDVAVIRQKTEDNKLVYEVTPRATEKRQLGVEAGIEVTPEKGATATASVDLAAIPGTPETVETFSLTLKGGNRSLTGEGEIVVDLFDPTPGGGLGTRWQVFLRADAEEIKDVYGGNLTRAAFTERRATVEAGARFLNDTLSHHQRFKAENPFERIDRTWRLLSKVDLGLRFRDVENSGSHASIARLDEGFTAGPYVKGDVLWTWYAPLNLTGRGLTRLDWENQFDLSSGFQALGADADYIRAVIASGPRIGIEFGDGLPGYLRTRATAGWVSDDAPTFALLAAGDPLFVRGLARDEFIGHRYVGLQAELGVNLFDLWARMAPAPVVQDAGSGAGEDQDSNPAIAEAFQHLNGAVFADFGWLSDRVQDGVAVDDTKALQGYGLLLSIRQQNRNLGISDFTIGYGYSPQSERRGSGVAFARANFTF